jgi:putative transposase
MVQARCCHETYGIDPAGSGVARGLAGNAIPALLEPPDPHVLDKLPKRLWGTVRKDLRKAASASNCAECRRQLEEIARGLEGAEQGPAAETVLRDLDDFLTFYDFPREHWAHLRTTNPLESVFAGVRLRTNVAKQHPNRDNAVCLVFKVVQRLARNWRRITGSNLCRLVLAGAPFVDGVLREVAA